MPDPLRDLINKLSDLLKPIFLIANTREIEGQEQYTDASIVELRTTLNNYKEQPSDDLFIQLNASINTACSRVQSPLIQYDQIIKLMEDLSNHYEIDTIELGDMKSALNSQAPPGLKQWLKDARLTAEDKARKLVEYQDRFGFSQIQSPHTDVLSAYLEEHPHFLANLITASITSFIIIAGSPISIRITDIQIAQAIIKHQPMLSNNEQENYKTVHEYINRLNNGILSNGRSVSTLMRNGDAKALLDTSDIFKIAQSEGYQTYARTQQFRAQKAEFHAKLINRDEGQVEEISPLSNKQQHSLLK